MRILTVTGRSRAYVASALVAAGCSGTSQVDLPQETVAARGGQTGDHVASVRPDARADGGHDLFDASGLPVEPAVVNAGLLGDAAAGVTMGNADASPVNADAATASEATAAATPMLPATLIDTVDASAGDAGRVDASARDAARVDAAPLDATRADAAPVDAARADAPPLDAAHVDGSRDAARPFAIDAALSDAGDASFDVTTRSDAPRDLVVDAEAATPFFAEGYFQSGPWMGWAFTAADSRGSTVSPSCTSSRCTPTWGSQACMAGTVAQDDDNESFAGLGFEVNHPRDGEPGSWPVSGTGLSVSVANAPPSTRVTLDELDADDQDERYCAPLPPGGTGVIPWSSFRTRCWGDPTRASVSLPLGRRIANVTITIPGTSTASQPFDLCVISLAPR